MGGSTQHTNGCGVCSGFWKFFKPPHHNFFKRQCDKHDILYTLGGDYRDRFKADLILFQEMYTHVRGYFYGRKPLSRLWFYILCVMYFLGVRLFGHTKFNHKTTIMDRILDFLFRFYVKYYGKGRTGSAISKVGIFKVGCLFLFSIALFSVGLGVNGGFIPVLLNIVISHVLTVIVTVFLGYKNPEIFDNRNTITLIVAVLAPMYTITRVFGGFSKLSNDEDKGQTE